MRQDKIVIRGAKEHNLKNIDLSIPRNKLVVMTGISGSGKSSLAFDTIYAEGQRRYVESLSSYARQFLGQMDKPDVESIEGLSPAISIDQKTTSRNPRSTVGTVTEIYDYLRLLYARIGIPHCPECGKEISQQTVDQIVDQIMELPNRTRIQVLAPIVRGRKGEYVKLFEDIKKMGFVRVRIDGEIKDIGEDFQLEKNKKHTIEIVVDRLIIKGGIEQRLTDSIETSLAHGNGIVTINIVDGEDIVFSQNFACVDCGISIEELTPRMFSFNSPYGACPKCDGIGVNMEIDVDLVIPDKNKSIIEGGIEPWGRSDGYYMQLLQAAAHQYDISLDKPINKLSSKELDIILYGSKKKFEFNYFNRRNGRLLKYETGFEGVINNLERRYRETTSNHMKEEIEEYMSKKPCPNCNGERLRKESRAVTINGKSISNITEMPIKETVKFFEKIELTQKEKIIARQVLKEINDRLGFMINVGLDYLTLARSAGTLSGGESQRIRLATQIGSQLMGVIYILDEPSIGLHQRDNAKLLKTLQEMRDLGNTLIVVEHDEETICTADHIIDIGPGAGGNGGEIVADGSIEDIMNCKISPI
ncbi:MAG TPA: excinuclease ABC subunit UvrA [Thermoanaerobacterales bacterium]|nr:excinuclease ABC subunit UvrA [Thermoanaerobacterales bacterium]